MPIKLNDRVKNTTALIVFLSSAVFGLFLFFSRYAYAEDGHNLLLTVYLLMCVVLFWGIRRLSVPIIAIAIVLALGVQVYAAQKFNWRQSYIESAMAGKPFALEEMIEQYPTYEQHMFPFLKAPDWVGFNDQCVQPALSRQPYGANCGSAELISMTYNIDIIPAMRNYVGKMQRTAKQLEEGKLTKRSEYLNCIASKACVTIPLLPKGVDADKLDPSSKDYIDIRQAFWSLVKDKKISKETCGLTDICKALVAMKVVNSESLPF